MQMPLATRPQRPARLMLEALDVGDEPAVVRKKRRARLELALHERCPDENLARRPRLDRAIGHPAVDVDRQAVERAALERHRLAAPRIPLRLVVLALDQVSADFLEPARLDGADRAGE